MHRNVSHAYPSDHHIASFFADALMNTIPWDYYTEGRAALGHTMKPAAVRYKLPCHKLPDEMFCTCCYRTAGT